jgi:hypothetical protein
VKGLQVATNGGSVTLALQVAKDVFQASMRSAEAEMPVEIEPVTTTPPLAPKGSVALPASIGLAPAPAPKALPAPPAPGAVPASTAAAEPAKPGPQIIRIYGLDEGPREIVLPPKEP